MPLVRTRRHRALAKLREALAGEDETLESIEKFLREEAHRLPVGGNQ